MPKLNQGIHQLKVTLKESKPPIWRQFQVPSDITLHRLHLILQEVMGWTNSHLYRFEIGGAEYGEPDPEYADHGIDMRNARRIKLNQVVSSEKMRFTYEYDFGDGWGHQVLVEKILPADPHAQYPVCIAGKQACPPENCGGIWGYAELLKIIRDPLHEEHQSMMVWLGGSFDPKAFDIDQVNRSLRHFRQSSKSRRPDVPEVFRRAFESEDQ
ncbi:plasmid pRiA4b ORF-3 family protein [Chloroflexota bacterium]